MMTNTKTPFKLTEVVLDLVKDGPWRFSEDLRLGHQRTRYYTRTQTNIALSLAADGQLAPIHVRANVDHFQILDGHLVVHAARQVGLKSLQAIVRTDLSDNQARLFYIHMNLNRCGQYGHYHVKIRREFEALAGDKDAKVTGLLEHTAWPIERVTDYVELAERDENWEKYMFVPKQEDVNQGGFEMDPLEIVVPDNQ